MDTYNGLSPLLMPSSTALLSVPSTMMLTESQSQSQPQTVNTKRCNHVSCKKKLLLSDMECKCGIRFCANHRFPEEHKCTFDFKAAANSRLVQQLVKTEDKRMVDKI